MLGSRKILVFNKLHYLRNLVKPSQCHNKNLVSKKVLADDRKGIMGIQKSASNPVKLAFPIDGIRGNGYGTTLWFTWIWEHGDVMSFEDR